MLIDISSAFTSKHFVALVPGSFKWDTDGLVQDSAKCTWLSAQNIVPNTTNDLDTKMNILYIMHHSESKDERYIIALIVDSKAVQ